jgi:ABC-type uncharacterized transport system auxiliary subunit
MKKYYLLLLLFLTAGCSFTREADIRNYYLLEYYEHTEKEELKQKESIDLSLQVNSINIPSTYNQPEIVIRHFGPRITYSENDIWAMRLTEILPGLLTKRIGVYNIFKHVSRDFLDVRPDCNLTLRINNIELFETEDVRSAGISMNFIYQDNSGSESVIIEHEVSRERQLLDYKIETFVQVINEIILDETDALLFKILRHYGRLPEKETPALADVRQDTLLQKISEEIEEGIGILLLPALSKTDNEPPYKVFGPNGEEYDGIPGESLPLPAGTYTVEYGSGSRGELMRKENVDIIPRYKTIIEPDWSCLIVNVIDERQEVMRVQYEIFEWKTGRTYGIGIPARREYGEKQQVWMLKPGRYKITINNEPFNTYRNFTTVYLNQGESQKITLVVNITQDGTPGDLIGAGVLEEDDLAGTIGHWHFLSAFYGNASVNSSNEKNKDEHETTLVFNTQFENKITYDKFPINYTLRNLFELGTTKTTETGFRISNDDTYFRNTLILYFLEFMGVYGRFDSEFHFLEEYTYFSSPDNYRKKDQEGNTLEEGTGVNKVKLKPPLFPLTLKEGIGINVRAFNTGRVNLNIRTGFGLRQDYAKDVYLFSEDEEVENDIIYKLYKAQEDVKTRGAEVSVIGNFQLPLNLTYYTNADVLFPFKSEEPTTIEWENVLNLKLFKYISIDYRLRLRNKQDESGANYIVNRHALFLRINYFAR